MSEKHSEVDENVTEEHSDCKNIPEEQLISQDNTNKTNVNPDQIQPTIEQGDIVKPSTSLNPDEDSKIEETNTKNKDSVNTTSCNLLHEDVQLQKSIDCNSPLDTNTEVENVQSIMNETDDTSISVDTEGKLINNLLEPCVYKALVRKDLEQVINDSDTQDSNNEDDKIELRWEDDDELEEDKTHLNDIKHDTSLKDSESNLLNIESIAEEDLNNPTLDETITSNNSYVPLTEHGLNRPDVMLEIPTQDFSELCDDDDDDNGLAANLEMSPDVEMGVLDASTKSDDVLPKKVEDIQFEISVEKEIEPNNCPQNVPDLSNDNNDSNCEIISSCKQDLGESLNPSEESKFVESSSLDENKLLGETQNFNEKNQNSTQEKNESSNITLNLDRDQETDMAVRNILDTSCAVESLVESTSKMDVERELSENKPINTIENEIQKESLNKQNEPQPSTSTHDDEYNTLENIPQDSNVVEMSDSLGLLAESSRVMEDDEEQEDDEDVEEDDDEDVDDDNSYQMTAENSEDSNAQNPSEVDSKDVKDDTPSTSDKETSGDGMNFTISEIVTEVDNGDQIEIEETIIEKEVEIEESSMIADEVKEVEVENAVEAGEVEESEEAEEIQEPVEIAMDIETVKISDTSDTEVETEKEETNIPSEPEKNNEIEEALVISEEDIPDASIIVEVTNKKILDFVDLEGTSSDEEILEVKKKDVNTDSVTTVKMPADIDVISSSAGTTSDIVMKETETVISGLPKPPPLKPARLNTSEVSIKTTNSAKESPKIVPETKAKSPMGLEVFNLDSDDEEPALEEEKAPTEPEKSQIAMKCINKACASDPSLQYSVADVRVIAFYEGDKKRRSYVCENCYHAVALRNQELIDGIRNFKPLLDLDFGKYHEELVEISDSDSEDEDQPAVDKMDLIGETAARFLEENDLTDMFNETWKKFKMDDRLEDTQEQLQEELKRLQKECSEIDEIFNECQNATDKLRNELYATFEPEIKEMPALTIFDANESLYISPENEFNVPETRQSKRRSSLATEPPAKRPAIPLGYTPLNTNAHASTEGQKATADKMDDDNTDISVVKLSVESAPADLPPPGPIIRAPLKVGMQVYAKKKASWVKATIVEIFMKNANEPFSTCRVKFENKSFKDPWENVSGRHLAYYTPADARMIIGTRVIALFKEIGIRESYSAGIVAEIPNPVNNYRYLIFFDDGYAQYAPHSQTRLVCESSALVWEEVHPDSRQFVRDYITSYPERPMVRLHAGQNLKTEYRGKWWASCVERVDASLVQVLFRESRRREWIYRGSTRLAPLFLELQAAERTRTRALPRAQPTAKGNVPYVEYTRSNEQSSKTPEPRAQNTEELRHQRSVAKKSTAASQPPPAAAGHFDNANNSRVVFYTPKNAVKPHKMVPHECGPKCKRTDVLELKDLRTYNPLAKPLLSGWERQVVRWKGSKQVMYVGGCGRRLRNMRELHRYLRVTRSDMSVDLFDFSPHTHCLAEFVLNKCIVAKKDLSHGKENVPVPCVNYYDNVLPEFCSYNTERTPTAGVPLNLDPEFLCGCDCEDDCEDKSKCACWQLTLEGARTIRMEEDVGYVYKRLPRPLPSGIYECNSRCKCRHTCLNRVAQHPLQLKLQVFKTLNRGWGIRALNDVPEGSFLCVYAGNLLTDATANLDGLNEGDEYLAELDYIEVVEQMKEGYEDDIPKDIKKLDNKELGESDSEEEEESPSSDDDEGSKAEPDDDFQPGYIGPGVSHFTKRLRRRDKNKDTDKKDDDKKDNDKKDGGKDKEEKTGNDEDCITISDDESREPSCFTAAAGMGANEFVSKYRSVRTLFGEDEACYIMDAKVQGNIGRYLNHSCSPNVFVQNVFVDTHDPRFPWVAFFALTHIRAGTELTWNYNYDVGSVPGKVLYCYCGAPNCRGRLL